MGWCNVMKVVPGSGGGSYFKGVLMMIYTKCELWLSQLCQTVYNKSNNNKILQWHIFEMWTCTHQWYWRWTLCPETPARWEALSESCCSARSLSGSLGSGSFLALFRSASLHRGGGLGSSLRKELQWDVRWRQMTAKVTKSGEGVSQRMSGDWMLRKAVL